MLAIINTDTREIHGLLSELPIKDAYQLPLLSVYVTSAEAETLVLPKDEWVPDPEPATTSQLVHTSGTIVPENTLNSAIARQDALKVRVQTILAFAQSVTGRSFSSLTTNELKGLLQLLFAMNGMVDIDGNVDLSDFTIDNILRPIK